MKKILLLLNASLIISLLGIFGCHKSEPFVDKGCGCNTDSIWHVAYYDNFGGYSDYNAMIGYDTTYGRNAWFIGVSIPNVNFDALLKICNPELPGIKALTDTIPRENGIPIRGLSIAFAGKMKKLCNNESSCFGCSMYFPETLFAHIITKVSWCTECKP